jgi:selenocysteine lyase/cysteine desulfurase
MHLLQCGGTARASFYLYNDESDVAAFERALKRTLEFFKVKPKAGVR